MINKQYEILGHVEAYDVTEVRVIPNTKLNHFHRSLEYHGGLVLCPKCDSRVNDVYIGINPRVKEEPGRNDTITSIVCMVVDVDPYRKKGIVATKSMVDESIKLARTIATDLKLDAFAVVSSGSGSHLYIPIDPIQNDVATQEKIKQFYMKLQSVYNTATQKIDSTFDVARVIRMWGSTNHKSNRKCEVVEYAYNGTSRNNFQGIIDSAILNLSVPTMVSHSSSKLPVLNLPERLNRIINANQTVNSILKGEVSFPSRSEADYVLIKELTKLGFSKEEIKSIAVTNPSGRKDELKDSDIERIIGKAVETNHTNTHSPLHETKKYFAGLKDRKPGIKSGIKDLDDKLNGFKPGNVYIIAARPSQGKTSLLTQIADGIASQGTMTMVFPTETGSEPLYDKIIARRTGVSLSNFSVGSFNRPDLDKIDLELKEFSKLPLVVVEDFGLTLEAIKAKIEKIQPGFVIIDYIQAMNFKEGGDAREITQVMRGLHQLANDFKIPLIVASQLNRGAEGTEVSMASLKGSGSLEEMADVVIAMWTVDKFVNPRPVDLHILKNRYGSVEKFRLMFDTSIGKFS